VFSLTVGMVNLHLVNQDTPNGGSCPVFSSQA
jgi:hypothetical protein